MGGEQTLMTSRPLESRYASWRLMLMGRLLFGAWDLVVLPCELLWASGMGGVGPPASHRHPPKLWKDEKSTPELISYRIHIQYILNQSSQLRLTA